MVQRGIKSIRELIHHTNTYYFCKVVIATTIVILSQPLITKHEARISGTIQYQRVESTGWVRVDNVLDKDS